MKSHSCSRLVLISAAAAALIALGSVSSASAQPMEGSVNNSGWTFNWAVDSTSGVRITQVHRNGIKYLHNGSLPAIRVQYNSGCGPFLDRIKWDNIVPEPGTGNKVRVTEDATWIRVFVQAQIVSYALVQGWWFHKSQGQIVPELSSSGLQCEIDHRHHPYWRLDFDVSTAAGNRVMTFKNDVFTTQTIEFNDTAPNLGNQVFFFPIADPSVFVNLLPGAWGGDGTADAFANWDYGGRLFPSLQNDPYAPGSPGFGDPGDLEAAGNPSTSNNGETIDNADVVFWYTAHLPHAAADGGMPWKTVGPNIFTLDN
jgi:hypothetical protein